MIRARYSIIIAFALAAPVGAADIIATLKPARQQDQAAGPYRTAILSVDNRSPSIVDGVELRSADGGPVMRFDATVSPRSADTFRVQLPATSLQQSWRIAFPDRQGSDEAATVTIPLTWPVELVSEKPFIAHDLYKPFQDALAMWPPRWKGHLMLGCVLMALAAGGTLFIRRPVLRWTAATAVVLLAGTAAVIAVSTLPAVVERTIAHPDGDGVLQVLSSRRTVRWHNPQQGVVPLYHSRNHMKLDDSTVIDDREGIWITLRPEEVRCLLIPTTKNDTQRGER